MDEKEFNQWIKDEVNNWRGEGIINDYQAEKILSKYGLAKPPTKEEIEPEKITISKPEYKSKKIITVLSILGSVLLGVGVILFFASNWNKIPNFLKLILLFGTTFGTYFFGYIMRFEKRTYPKVGHALLFLASIFVGATIFLIAQIFNVNVNAHWLVFLWFLAISPLAYAFDSKPILGLNIFTFGFWMITYVSSLMGWGRSTFEVFMLYLLFGITLYGLGQLHVRFVKYSKFRTLYQWVGLFFILVSYFYFSLESPYRTIGKLEPSNWVIQLLFGVFALLSIISIGGSIPTSEKVKGVKYEFSVLLVAFIGWIGLWTISRLPNLIHTEVTRHGQTFMQLKPQVGTALFIIFNLILFSISIGTILIGYYKREAPFVNVGMLFFVLGIIHLYTTTLYKMLPRSLAFIVGGLILLFSGWYLEKKRRSLLEDMKLGEPIE